MSAETEQLTLGEVVAVGSYEIDRDDLVRYAGASGDFNPIHYRDDVATAVGLPGVLAHGMLTMGLAVQPVVDRFGGDRIRDYQVRFTRPVPVPPEGTVLLELEAKVGLLDGDEARIDVTAKVGGQTVLGRAQVRVALGRPVPGPHSPEVPRGA
jgi:acyl dehydratase